MKSIIKDNYIIHFECVSKLYSYLLIRGIIYSNDGSSLLIKDIQIIGSNIQYQKKIIISNLNSNNYSYNFSIEALTSSKVYEEDIHIDFILDKNKFSINIIEALHSIEYINNRVSNIFFDYIKNTNNLKVLDLGGRARSGLLRSSEFPNTQTTVVDIIQDEGVDIVCDAHCMSDHLKNNYFDACMCISVFEHLIMPWKVVLEINKVLKNGGLCLIATHQTIGMHDIPWDYFRFSDTAWNGLFNKFTGFEIIDKSLSGLNYIIPFVWSEDKNYAESTAGYESSVVLVRKIKETKLKWPVIASDIIDDKYPE